MNKTLLIVDDGRGSSALEDRIIMVGGYVILRAQTEQATYDILDGHEIDLLLLDLDLSKVNGDRVIHWLKAKTRFSRIPIIATSAYTVSDEIDYFMKLGVTKFFVNPYDERTVFIDRAANDGSCYVI